LLFLARLDAGALSLESGELDLVEAAREAIASSRPAAEAKQVALDLDAPAHAYTQGDAQRIGQALDNLISNAVKFTPSQGTVQVSIENGVGDVQVSVTDSGCGIPEAEQGQVFERFFRSSTSTHVPGTGLGLAIVKAIVESHGGSIKCESAEGRGTTFTFSIPLADTPASDLVVAAPEAVSSR
jgi:signal transduction histidine kinase